MTNTTESTEHVGLDSVLATPANTHHATSAKADSITTVPAVEAASTASAQIARQVLSMILRPGTNQLRTVSELNTLLIKEDA